MSAAEPRLSDLVRDSKIETELLDQAIRHVFYESGRPIQERHILREERWVREKELGRGAFGTVYLERCADGGGSPALRAVKELKKYVTRNQEIDYLVEIEAIVKFSGAQYKHCFVQSNGWFEIEDSVFITMEYLELGDLQAHLDRPLPELGARRITVQVLEGLNFMHQNGFVHRDLKPGNIMVVAAGPDWIVKIGDFGISKRRREDVTSLHTLQRGTLGYIAPEVLGFGANSAITSYTSSVDVWSLGAVTYRMLTNLVAFPNVAAIALYATGNLAFPSQTLISLGVSEEGQAFVRKLLLPTPKDRPSTKLAATDPWMALKLTTTDNDSDQTSQNAQPRIEVQDSGMSVASKAWTTQSEMALEQLQYLTIRPLSTSNYQAPFVEDDHEQSIVSKRLRLPSDAPMVLEPASYLATTEPTSQSKPVASFADVGELECDPDDEILEIYLDESDELSEFASQSAKPQWNLPPPKHDNTSTDRNDQSGIGLQWVYYSESEESDAEPAKPRRTRTWLRSPTRDSGIFGGDHSPHLQLVSP